jgi:hypothetical protein
MISDEQDEDADYLDDGALLQAYLGHRRPKRTGVAGASGPGSNASGVPDWPPPWEREVGLDLKPATIVWFRATHVDWRSTMSGVLRAWVVAHTPRQPQSGSEEAGLIDTAKASTAIAALAYTAETVAADSIEPTVPIAAPR